MRRAVSISVDHVLNFNTLFARLIRLVVAVGIGSIAFIELLLFFALNVQHMKAAPSIQPLTAPCSTPVITLTAVEDTWIDENDPNQTHSADLALHTKPNVGDRSRPLVQFNLSSIPVNSIINCATLRLYERNKDSDQTIHIHRITSSWKELEATWLNRKTGTPWTANGGDYDLTEVTSLVANTSGGYQEIDVTQLVQFWVDNPGLNFGVLLRSTAPSSKMVVQFDSHEAINDPQLVVDYGNIAALSIKKTGSSNFIAPGAPITYTIVVNNSGNLIAVGLVISDSLPANTSFVNNSITLDPPGAGTVGTSPPLLAGNLIIPAGQQVTVTFVVKVNTPMIPGTIITNKTELISSEILTPTATFTSAVTGLFNPILFIDKNGPVTATIGDVLTFTYRVLNHPWGDGTLISDLKVTDSIAGAATLMGGDYNNTGQLEVGEAWSFMATYTVKATDPNPLVNIVVAQGRDQEYEIIRASDTFTTTLEIPPFFIPIVLKAN